MKKISIKGVLVGGVTDIVATNILTLPILIYATNKLDLARASPEQLQAALHANTSLYALQLLIGFGCSALGGYVAAWLAKHDELLNGPLSSFLCMAFGIYSLAASPGSNYRWEELLLLPASPACGLLGGYLRRRQRQARLQPA